MAGYFAMLTFLIVAVPTAFLFLMAVDMFLHLFACLEAKKNVYVECRKVLSNGNKSALRKLCRKYPDKFHGWSTQYAIRGDKALRSFVARRLYA